MKWFRGGLVFKADGLVHHSTLGWRAIQKKNGVGWHIVVCRMAHAAVWDGTVLGIQP